MPRTSGAESFPAFMRTLLSPENHLRQRHLDTAARIGTGVAKDGPIALYPAYFDLDRSRHEGRRVPRKLAVDSPSAEEIERAAKALGLAPEVEPSKAHSATPWKKEGRVLVRSEYYKTSILRRVAEKLKASRQK